MRMIIEKMSMSGEVSSFTSWRSGPQSPHLWISRTGYWYFNHRWLISALAQGIGGRW